MQCLELQKANLTFLYFPLFFLQGEVGDQGRPGAPAYSPHPSLAKGLYVISPACLHDMYILSCYRHRVMNWQERSI